ncbi:MAG: amidohydrolase family protein [Deltaproteobacteria bacterium]|nr:amidohydrolase family protein [Deltaproteobacteria bacterium]
MTDTLIKNARIFDGTGALSFRGHVLIEDDRIHSVVHAAEPENETFAGNEAAIVINADGMALAPGFIDCHSHFDWVQPLSDHETFLYPMLEQGITTVVTGNCGFSPAPIPSAFQSVLHEYSQMLMERPLNYQWEDMGEFLDYLEAMDGLMFNHVQQVGHGTVQLAALGSLCKRPSTANLAEMEKMTHQSLDQGASGMSLGLMYPPGLFSTREELAALARVVADRGRLLTVHKRALSRYSGAYPIIPFFSRPHNLRALEEVLSIGLETGVKVQISHFIFVGRRSWPTAEKAIKMIEAAAGRGLEIMWDIYPHFCGNSYLDVFLPAWFIENLGDNLEKPSAVRRLKFELALAKRLLGFDMSDIWIMDAAYPEGEKYNGRCLTEIAQAENADPISTMLKIVRDSDSKALQLTYGYSGDDKNEELIEMLMAHPRCLYETDTILKSRGFANPGSYGAFPRILGHFARDKGMMPMEQAVHKMTGATARWMDIVDRGEIRPGAYADLVLFEPDTIADNTTKEDTARRPTGIDKVFCNGTLVVEDGEYVAGKKAGEYLPSYLVRSEYQSDVIHILFAIDVESDNIRIITAYRLNSAEWEDGFRIRRRLS